MRNLKSVVLASLITACTPTEADVPDASPAPDAGHDQSDGGSRDAQTDLPDARVGDEVCSLPAVTGPCDALFMRWFHDAETGNCEIFTYGGCQGNANNFETLAACEAACVDAPPPRPCDVDATDDSLPGVTIHVESHRCNFEVGQPGEFTWKVDVAESVTYQVEASAGCGSCKTWGGNNPGQLVTYRVGTGDVHYCECDTGCCPPDMSMAYTLEASSGVGRIAWPGRQWDGPSDTNNPLGEPFPAGSYDVEVSLALPGAGSVTAKLPIIVE
jgi:hypothetical protein